MVAIPSAHLLPREVVLSSIDMALLSTFTHWAHSQAYEWASDGDSKITTKSFIGIVVAISGNIIISLALNCQKLAHLRLDRERELFKQQHVERLESLSQNGIHRDMEVGGHENHHNGGPRTSFSTYTNDDTYETWVEDSFADEDVSGIMDPEGGADSTELRRNGLFTAQSDSRGRVEGLLLETEPLIGDRRRSRSPSTRRAIFDGYNSADASRKPKTSFLSKILRKARNDDINIQNHAAFPAEGRVGAIKPILKNVQQGESTKPKGTLKFDDRQESDYLKSKLWWLGLLLMSVGELGNFISYGFAAASVVAPLGTFALIANCFFAPLMLKEKFRKQDFIGIALAILGAVTVVLSANPSDVRLDPDGLIRAISQRPFIVLSIIYAIGIVVLVGLSSRHAGHNWVYVDVGTCALFGGFTVLSTKAFSTLLTMEWYAIFKEWITYPVLAVMIGTAIGQVRYLNRALMKFDSKVVIPAQFVMFTLSAIIGSAVLYGDFRNATLHQMVTFLYGCGATFAGVFVLTSGPGHDKSEERDEERVHGEHVTILPPSTPSPRPRAAPLLRRKTSRISILGLSPAQRVLLVRPLSPGNAEDVGDTV